MSERDRAGSKRGTTWVLDSETKGTGAQMVPLDKLADSAGGGRSVIVVREPKPPPPKPAEPAGPRRFRVVDVMTQQVVADDAGLRDALAALAGMRSVVDVSVYVWDEHRSLWRALDIGERKALWELRGRAASG